MTLSEKSAYLKGLMDGLNLSKETPEGKMIAGIVDLLQEMTTSISDLEENAIAVSDELDEIEEDLDAIEEYLMDEDDDDEDGEELDEDFFEVACPNCGEDLVIDDAVLEAGSIDCPVCGQKFALSFEDEDGCECDCGCDHDHDHE